MGKLAVRASLVPVLRNLARSGSTPRRLISNAWGADHSLGTLLPGRARTKQALSLPGGNGDELEIEKMRLPIFTCLWPRVTSQWPSIHNDMFSRNGRPLGFHRIKTEFMYYP
uniref:Uncharacterized protein n=1 Tax=Arundo donax TaxID=35708 RepID=A0A0A9EGG7_ARUDO